MIQDILPDFYRMEIPLPNSPLKALNAYLIKGKQRSLIIDTGMNRDACRQPMRACLETLDVDLSRTDFFITHLHADHIGLVGTLATETSNIYFNRVEASVLNRVIRHREERQRQFITLFISNGVPEDEIKKAIENHPGFRYSPTAPLDFQCVQEGDVIDVGEYSFRCIESPGHSPGHTCLYESNKKILVSGDHILADITPNITCWPEFENSLNSYLTSLDKVHAFDVDLVLPGHRSLINDCRKRIAELKEHHRNRLNEALSAIAEGDKTAWEVAPHIAWDIRVESWELFPPVQKWFAMGETIAHLHYLEGNGKICKKHKDGTILYTLASKN